MAVEQLVAAQWACIVDQRLDGADRGFRAWLNAQALRREAAEATDQAAMARDDPAAVVAGHVLAAYLDAVPYGFAARLADWLMQHIASTAGRGDRARWQ